MSSLHEQDAGSSGLAREPVAVPLDPELVRIWEQLEQLWEAIGRRAPPKPRHDHEAHAERVFPRTRKVHDG